MSLRKKTAGRNHPDTETGAGDRVPGTGSLRRAIDILRALATSREVGLGLSEMARLTGLPHPTVHRMLKALAAEGLVEQKPATRRYVVGEQIQFLALSRERPSLLQSVGEPHIARAAEAIGDTVFLTQRTGLDTICIARKLGPYPIQVLPLRVGDRRPLGVSSAGLALLAALEPAEAASVIAENRERLGAYRIDEAAALGWVRAARDLGYALRDRGIVPGTRALSVAIRDERHQAYAAVTIAGITRRMTYPHIETLTSELRSVAHAIERDLVRAKTVKRGAIRSPQP